MLRAQHILPSDVYHNPLLRLHLFAMRLFGFAIFVDQRRRYLHHIRGVFLSAVFAVFNVTQYVDLINQFGHFDQMTTNASTTLLFTTTVLRMYQFYANRSTWISLIDEVHVETEYTWTYGSKKEIEILNRHVRYTVLLTIVFWVVALGTANLMCFKSLAQSFVYVPDILVEPISGANITVSDPPMILRSWFPFEDYWQHFYIIYAVQFFVMWIGMIIVPSWNTLMVALMSHAIVSLEQLNHRLQNPAEYNLICLSNNGTPENQSMRKEHIYRHLIDCTNKCNRIKIYVADLEKLIRAFVFLDFMLFSILLCTLLYQASRTPIGVQMAIHICYIFTMISILWMYYWHANEIMFWSDALSGSLYSSRWYEQSSRYKKLVHLFMVGTIRPIKMRAASLEMNLSNLLQILSASYSYFTILKQLDS